MYGIENRTAIVTGASRGIGRGIALALAKDGVNVCVNYLSNHQQAKETVEQILSEGGNAIAVAADVSNQGAVKNLVTEAASKFGEIDILVNNAGIAHKDALENITEDDWNRVIDVNLKSAFLMTQECLPFMKRNRWGRIVFISSVAAQTGGVTGPLYCASKAGMIGLAHSYASLLFKEGITSNAVTPALIETEMVTKVLKVDASKIPLGRFGKVEEVADVVVLLAKNGYINGQTVNVNGGWYYS